MRLDNRESLSNKSIRVNNTTNIINSLILNRDLTRNELASSNNISLMTVKHVVDELISQDVIYEQAANSSVGRKPMVLNIAQKYGNIICINLTSNYSIRYVFYDIHRNEIAAKDVAIAPREKYYDLLIRVLAEIGEIEKSIQTELIGIGVEVASAYYEDKDLVNYDLISGLKGIHIKQVIKDCLGVENVRVFHDVVSAAQSEYDISGQNYSSMYYFYCGYGIGSYYIDHNIPLTGENFLAGEVGKILVPDLESEKLIPLEDVASITGLVRRMSEGRKKPEFEKILENYKAGDPDTKKVVDQAVSRTAVFLYNIIWIYNPTAIIIDSINEEYAALILKRTQALVKKLSKSKMEISVILRLAKYSENREMRGCFYSVLHQWIDVISNKGRE